LFEIEPAWVVSDLHPDYRSTREAKNRPEKQLGVQHHFAHVLSCMAENELEGPVLGIAWDGTGYGLDGMIWGGEFLISEWSGYERFATLRPFRLPGGERAIREPRRSAMGLLYELVGERAFELPNMPPLASFGEAELRAVRSALDQQFNAPLTTAVGRLFDGVASLLGIRQRVGFEGQAAMGLEWLAVGARDEAPYEIEVRPVAGAGGQSEGARRIAARDALWHADWAPMIDEILRDLRLNCSTSRIAARFHSALMELIVRVAAQAGLERVALSGGCFQNVVLLEGVIHRLRGAGHQVYWHQRVPTSDGGLALGQAAAGLRACGEGGRG
jgi:hydrogenase maturation protein HypF